MFPDCVSDVIFTAIRDLPYRVPERVDDDQAWNCLSKNRLLMNELKALGHNVRDRIGLMSWESTPTPRDIVALYPADIPATHYFLEIEKDGHWRALDASWDKDLEKAGFPIAEFGGRRCPGIKTERVFTQTEQDAYLKEWSSPSRIADYFQRAGPFLRALNAWLKDVRA